MAGVTYPASQGFSEAIAKHERLRQRPRVAQTLPVPRGDAPGALVVPCPSGPSIEERPRLPIRRIRSRYAWVRSELILSEMLTPEFSGVLWERELWGDQKIVHDGPPGAGGEDMGVASGLDLRPSSQSTGYVGNAAHGVHSSGGRARARPCLAAFHCRAVGYQAGSAQRVTDSRRFLPRTRPSPAPPCTSRPAPHGGSPVFAS